MADVGKGTATKRGARFSTYLRVPTMDWLQSKARNECRSLSDMAARIIEDEHFRETRSNTRRRRIVEAQMKQAAE